MGVVGLGSSELAVEPGLGGENSRTSDELARIIVIVSDLIARGSTHLVIEVRSWVTRVRTITKHSDPAITQSAQVLPRRIARLRRVEFVITEPKEGNTICRGDGITAKNQ